MSSDNSSDEKIVTVCGGGNGAHTFAILASSNEALTVNVLSLYADEAERWNNSNQATGYTTAHRDDEVIKGKINLITKDPTLVIPQSDLIVFVMPAFAHQFYFQAIKDHIGKQTNRRVILGSMPAEGGFDIEARYYLGETFDHIDIFGLETLPWACRLNEFGKDVGILGTKVQVDIAIAPSSAAERVIAYLGKCIGPKPVLTSLDSLLNCTLMNINSVWHPAITYGCYRNWDFKTPFDSPPLFYEGVDDFTADLLTRMSNEVLQLKQLIEKEYGLNLPGVIHVKEWMMRSYKGDMKDETNLRTMINTNKGYQGLTHKVKQTEDGKYLPDFTYRYTSEDIPFGLVVTRGIAEIFGMATPSIDMVIEFLQKAMGKEYLVDGKVSGKDISNSRCPQRFGITDKKQFMEWCRYI